MKQEKELLNTQEDSNYQPGLEVEPFKSDLEKILGMSLTEEEAYEMDRAQSGLPIDEMNEESGLA